MKSTLLHLLEQGIVVGDGAMGTLLYERGVTLDRCCEELVLTQPAIVSKVHVDYIEAGSQVIETNSFAANRLKLARHGLEHRVREINGQAAQLARVAAAQGRGETLVAGSIGPLGGRLDDLLAREVPVHEIFREQIEALAGGGVDLLFFETFTDLEELKLALGVARKFARMDMVCSLSFTEEGTTFGGRKARDVFQELIEAGARIVGANCSVGPSALVNLYQRHAGPAPAGTFYSAFPNSGRPQFMDGRYYYWSSPDYFAKRAKELIQAGVRFLGGCCGTRPEHIAALRKLVDSIPAKEVASFKSGIEFRAEPEAPVHHPEMPHAEPTLLELGRDRTLIVTEFDSPKTLLMDKMIAAGRALKKAGTDFVTVADNSLAILRMNCVVASHLVERETGLRAIVHMACRDRNLIGTQSELMGMDALGLDHVLALTGDPSKVGDTPGATSVYDLNSISLLEGIRSMNEGRTFTGRDLKRATRFVSGCSFNPNVRNLDIQVKRLERKLAAGAQFVMTQPVFDLPLVKATHDALKNFGVPVLIGVMPLLNTRTTEFLHNEVPGIVIPSEVRERMRGKEGEPGAKEGMGIAREITAEILRHFNGIYLITPLVRYECTVELSSAIRSKSI